MLNALTTILDEMDAYVYVSDLETNEVLFVNRKIRNTFGMTVEPVGQPCWKVMQTGYTGRCEFCPLHKLEKNPDVPIVWEMRNTITGRYHKNTDSIIEWTDGRKVHLEYSIDINDMKQAQQEANKSLEVLKNILDGMDSCVYVSDMSTDEILFINKRMKEAFNLDDGIVGETCWKALQSGFTERCAFCPNPKLEADNTTSVVWEEHNTVTGRHYKNVDSVIEWMDGKKVHMQHSIDITQHVTMENDLKAAKDAAENASRAKSQFLSNMSHEIRTPMNAIIGMTEILLSDELNDRQLHYMNDIKVSATALLSIINDILDFSKIEAGKLQLIPVDYNIYEMLENIESMFSFAAEAKSIYFYMDIRDKLPDCLHGDDIRLRQALINVIGNAVKFTRTGGVTLTVSAADDMLVFNVADTGIGIKEEDLPTIFSDFGQLDMRNNRNIAGTGLGLSITKNLIALMDGHISVESEYGNGTTFQLLIPLVEGDSRKMISKTRMFESIDAPDAEILVVDDNEVNLHVAAGMLKLSGIVCDTALSGWEAIRKIEAKKYDLVFMDHMMPEMDGVETTRLLRDNYDEEHLIIVALTANAVEGAKETLLGARMNDYLSKPIDKIQLNQILIKWLPPEKIRTRRAPSRPTAVMAASELTPLLDRANAIDGLNVRLGLERIGGLHDAYEQTLRIFTRRLPEALTRLADYLDEGNLKAFSIEVHGLKGSLNNIGATRLGTAAEELEHCSVENDALFCRENLPAFLNDLDMLHERLLSVLGNDKPAAPTEAGDSEALPARLIEVRTLLDAFESDEAIAIVRELAGYDYGDRLNEALAHIAHAVEEFDYDRALAVIDGM